MTMANSVQDTFLEVLCQGKEPVSIFMVNGIKLQGTIESYDQFVVVLKNVNSQVVYKHAISTIMPSRNIRMPAQHQDSE